MYSYGLQASFLESHYVDGFYPEAWFTCSSVNT